MALHQSSVAKRRETPPNGYQSGIVLVAVFTYAFTKDFTAATDKLELGLLPAGAKPISARLVPVGLTADNTADVGLMDGEPGEPDNDRTVGDEFFDGVAAVAAEASATAADLLAIAPAETHRGIGVTMTEDIAAGASKSLTLVLEYTF